MAGSNRVTIEEIGERLKISTSTVSRALRQDPLIHPETRARVNALAIDLGYQGRSRQGPSRGKKKNSLAVLFSNSSLARVRSGYITTSYLQGLTSEAESAEIPLNLHTVSLGRESDFQETAGLPRSLWSDERDAVIVIGHHHHETIKLLAQKLPIISLVWEYPEVRHDLVNTPDIPGMALIVQELARLKHKRLAWVGGPIQGSFVESRKAGFIYGCLQNGLAPADQYFFEAGLFSETGVAHPERVVAAVKQGITGFVCASDHAAEMLIASLKTAGIRVPQDVSVAGFDYSTGGHHEQSRPLTSIDPQFVEMGRTAVRLAKWRLEQPSSFPMTLTMKARLILGDSTGPVPRSRNKG